jgi:hypothetical protein
MSNSTFLPLWTDDGTYYELKFQRDIKFDYDVEFAGSDSDINFTLTTVSAGAGKSFTYTCGDGSGTDAAGGNYTIDLGASTGTGMPGLLYLNYGGTNFMMAGKDLSGAGTLMVSNSADGDNGFVQLSATALTSGNLMVWGDNFAMGAYDAKAGIDYSGMPEFGIATSYGGGIKSAIGTVQTTDATTTTIFTSPVVADNETYQFEAIVTGMKSDGSDRALYKLTGLFYRNGGNVTQEGATISLATIESDATWGAGTLGTGCDFTLDTGNQKVLVRVEGLAATTINWKAVITYNKVTAS